MLSSAVVPGAAGDAVNGALGVSSCAFGPKPRGARRGLAEHHRGRGPLFRGSRSIGAEHRGSRSIGAAVVWRPAARAAALTACVLLVIVGRGRGPARLSTIHAVSTSTSRRPALLSRAGAVVATSTSTRLLTEDHWWLHHQSITAAEFGVASGLAVRLRFSRRRVRLNRRADGAGPSATASTSTPQRSSAAGGARGGGGAAARPGAPVPQTPPSGFGSTGASSSSARGGGGVSEQGLGTSRSGSRRAAPSSAAPSTPASSTGLAPAALVDVDSQQLGESGTPHDSSTAAALREETSSSALTALHNGADVGSTPVVACSLAPEEGGMMGPRELEDTGGRGGAVAAGGPRNGGHLENGAAGGRPESLNSACEVVGPSGFTSSQSASAIAMISAASPRHAVDAVAARPQAAVDSPRRDVDDVAEQLPLRRTMMAEPAIIRKELVRRDYDDDDVVDYILDIDEDDEDDGAFPGTTLFSIALSSTSEKDTP